MSNKDEMHASVADVKWNAPLVSSGDSPSGYSHEQELQRGEIRCINY